MRLISVFLLCLLLGMAKQGYGSEWRSKEPLIINGVVYYVTMTYGTVNNSEDVKYASFRFYMVCSERGHYKDYNQAGSYFFVSRTFTGKLDNNVSQSTSYPTRMLSTRDNPYDLILKKYKECFPTFYNNEIQVILFTGNNDENIQIAFTEVKARLFTNTRTEAIPAIYMDTGAINNATRNLQGKGYSEEQVNATLKQGNWYQNFTPKFCSDIDSREFPDNASLRQFLSSNTEFQLQLNRDLYWEIMRFRQVGVEYDKDKIKDLMESYDRNYAGYRGNEIVMERKITAFVNLLREAAKYINLGDIFYKDLNIEIGKYDFQDQSFPILDRDYNDDFFSTKRLAGTTSMFVSSKGLSIFLPNWVEFSSLSIPQAEAESLLGQNGSGNRKAKLRVYFLIQPIPCYDVHSSFRGVVAYGLGADFFRDCINDGSVRRIRNAQIGNILEPEIKRCFQNAFQYLYEYLDQPEENIYASAKGGELNYGAVPVGNWSQNHPESCEVGYFSLNGEIRKKSQEEREMALYLRTNYYYILKAGYEVVLYNSHTGTRFPLVIRNLLQVGKEGGASVMQLYIKVTRTTLLEMINAKVNAIEIQTAGATKYNWTGNPMYNWDKTIQPRRNSLGIYWRNAPNETVEALLSFLKKGL